VSLTLLGLAVYAAFGVVQHAEVLLGLIDERESWAHTVLRRADLQSGHPQRREMRLGSDPSLTHAQTAFACVGIAISYAITGRRVVR
jgi:hypothetical protein